MRTTHLISRLGKEIELGVTPPPAYWDAVIKHPMISILRKKLDPNPMKMPDDKLIELISKRQSHLDDEPHALAPGLSKYYKHPKQIFLERWKYHMEQGWEQEEAYQNVLLEQYHDSLIQKIEHDDQVRQAAMFGVPAPDIPEQLTAIDRDMNQAIEPGIISRNQQRLDKLLLIAHRKMGMMDANLPDHLSDSVPSAQIAELMAPFTSSDISNPDPLTRDDIDRKKLEKQEHQDFNRSHPDHLHNEAPHIEKMVQNASPLTFQDVREIIPDSLWPEFRSTYPQLERAFDPILWTTDTFFAEQYYTRIEPVVRGQLEHPSATELRAKQAKHLLDLGATAPFLGKSPSGEPLDPTISNDLQNVTNLMDLVKLYSPFDQSTTIPQPEDLVKYSSTDINPVPSSPEGSPSVVDPEDCNVEDRLFSSDPHADPLTLLNAKVLGNDNIDLPSLTTEDLHIQTELAKSGILKQLETLRSHLAETQKIEEEAFKNLRKVKPHDDPLRKSTDEDQ